MGKKAQDALRELQSSIGSLDLREAMKLVKEQQEAMEAIKHAQLEAKREVRVIIGSMISYSNIICITLGDKGKNRS